MKQLDLGCGNTPRIQDGVTELVGIDIAKGDMITNPNVIQGVDLAIGPIPCSDNEFDLVTAFDFMEHIPSFIYIPHYTWEPTEVGGVWGYPAVKIVKRNSMVELFNEIYRVLKPGGKFLMKSPLYPHQMAFQDPTHVFFWTINTVNYFSGDYFGFHDHYGHTSRFELMNVANENHWLVAVFKAIKTVPKEHEYELHYGGAN